MLTVFLTVISGVLTLVIGQLVLKLLIEPVHEFKRTVADIALALIEYANVYANPVSVNSEREAKASETLRKLSSRLNAQLYLIPYYPRIYNIFGLPSKDKVLDAAKELMGLSNSVNAVSDGAINHQTANKIRNALKIFVPEN